ncbi:type I-E CRISPR-associated protein Cas6/Cse3/CasE [Oscillatoria sp. CS-180]|uniref:type I-E CRISPR-associated protein Cas6/Cse3/CasE n=1 Tax=Oscillatoria sp. CS-180 TaxID=3021720 RepID=UPI00232F2CB2|nr:type I-E CRISPR-associated protein Cas6/Cse3/CasE [Oscillatoria sp. CS-180]MDB9524390.1 type I-E CRISPR-associated protein Cas6/Cse3/CasE [Oscillatoria sp. CS-180]
MYLSKLLLNSQKTFVLRELGNAHKFHQRIMQAFPDEDSRDRPREDWHVLFRQEPDSDVVLVQSEIEPDWTKLPDLYLRHYAIKAMSLTAESLSASPIFQFRLRANPSKRDNKTKKIIGFYHRSDQLAWLERQGDRCGFRLLNPDVIPSPSVFGIKKKGTAPIRITTALFQGVLEVTASELFLSAVQLGLGRGKSYGCGLLSLARIRT